MDRAVYRIMDANFNRAREAARMMEEYCRFKLNDKSLSSKVKGVRHKLCAAYAKLDSEKLIVSRDSSGDVGRGMVIGEQLKRGGLEDCFTAAAKRLSEALRVLAEMAQAINAEVCGIFEELRFEAYDLEKKIVIAGSAGAKYSKVRLYILITAGDKDSDEKVLRLAKACADGGADCIQLRYKGMEDDRFLRLADGLVKICKSLGVVSIINDRVDIAVASEADGVHLGQGDIELERVRGLALRPMIFGVSTHNPEQLTEATKQRPTYIAMGSMFATGTKDGAEVVGVSYARESLKIVEELGIGHVAIGGITLNNMDEVLEAGVRTIAVCSAVTGSTDPAGMCSRFKAKLEVTS